MRTLRKLTAALCPSAAYTFLLPGQLPIRRCAHRQPGDRSRPAIRGATARPPRAYAACSQRVQGPRLSRWLDAANRARSERPWTS